MVSLTKENIETIIKKSIDQPQPGKVTFPSRPWTACNQDSAFFNKDTTYFCTNSYYTQRNSNCCSFISWTFYNSNGFVRQEDQTCIEPSSAKAYTDNNSFKFLIIEKDGLIFIQTFNKNKPVDNYKILFIERLKKANSIEEFEKITVVRQH